MTMKTDEQRMYAQKYAIEKTVGRVENVKVIAVEMDFKVDPWSERAGTTGTRSWRP